MYMYISIFTNALTKMNHMIGCITFVQLSQPLSLFPGASACFSQLNYLHVNTVFVNSNSLYEMAQICKDLNELGIYDCTQDLPGLISLIDAQRNLKSLKIYHHGRKGNCNEIGKALARNSFRLSSYHHSTFIFNVTH